MYSLLAARAVSRPNKQALNDTAALPSGQGVGQSCAREQFIAHGSVGLSDAFCGQAKTNRKALSFIGREVINGHK